MESKRRVAAREEAKNIGRRHIRQGLCKKIQGVKLYPPNSCRESGNNLHFNTNQICTSKDAGCTVVKGYIRLEAENKCSLRSP